MRAARTPRQRRELAIRLMAEGRPVSTGMAAEILTVDVKTVARWCRDGRIASAYRTPGGHWRIPASEIARRVLGEDNQGE